MDTPLEQQQTLKAQIYLMLSALFRAPPSEEIIDFLCNLEIEPATSPMQKAWLLLQQAAKESNQEQLAQEYQDLFIGIGHGEVIAFASWHIAGSMMDAPLAEIRHDLQLLGIEREPQVKEPEDHISALCEVMAMLAYEDQQLQQIIFNKHIAPWFEPLTRQILTAPSADFYKPVAMLCNAFLTLEQVHFSVNTASSKYPSVIDVKNITQFVRS